MMQANDTTGITTWLQECTDVQERLLEKKSALRDQAAQHQQALQDVLAEHTVPPHME